jgi:hypothetical protein
MNTVPFRADYFRVQLSAANPGSFEDLLEHCANWPAEADERNLNETVFILRLQELHKDGPLWCGDMLYIDMTQTSLKADIRGKIDPVKLLQDEGIAKAAAFLYDPQLNVLALESQHVGPTRRRVIGFFERSTPVLGEIHLEPILRLDAYKRFTELQDVTTFQVKVAGGIRGAALEDAEDSVRGTLELAKELDAPTIEIKVSVGRSWRSDSISKAGVFNYVKSALSLNSRSEDESDSVRFDRLEASGLKEDGQMDHIDLIKERMRDQDELAPDNKRVISYERRLGMLQSMYDGRVDELSDIFGSS